MQPLRRHDPQARSAHGIQVAVLVDLQAIDEGLCRIEGGVGAYVDEETLPGPIVPSALMS